jgi:hypothetical protein
MPSRSWIVGIGTFLTIGLLAPRLAFACSCAYFMSPCQGYRTEVVFAGEVVSVDEVSGRFQMRLRVLRAYKGLDATTVDVWSDAQSSCGVKLDVGGRYVIYTNKGRMTLHACGGYGQHLQPGEPLPDLPPVPGSVYGRVTRYDTERIRRFRPMDPISSVLLWLDLPAGRVSSTSDAWGRFRFDNVPPGKYPIGVDAGPLLTPWIPDTVTMTAERGCEDASVVLHPSGRLTGRLVSATGRPVKGQQLLVLDALREDRQLAIGDFSRPSTADGRFEFDGLTPGEYLVALNPHGFPSSRSPYGPVFLGGADRAAARPVRVGPNLPTELPGPVVLPPPLPTRTFTVSVKCQDGGTPPAWSATASATLRKAGDEYASDYGQGELVLLRDVAYTLRVGGGVSVDVPGSTARRRQVFDLPPVEIPAALPGKSLSFVVPFSRCGDDGR